MNKAEEIRKRVRSLDEIPTLPAFFTKLMETIENDRASVRDLANIVGEDPALASKILKLANSAYYGRFKKVATAEQAVATVGFNEIKTISLSIGVFGSFSDRISNECLMSFWVHALTTATAIRCLGDRGQESTIDKLYFGGLLHDIGKLVLTLLFGDEYLSISSSAPIKCRAPLDQEKDTFGANHGQVGKWLAERWHFPNELGEIIAYHHYPRKSGLLRPRSIASVYLGDFIAHSAGSLETIDREEMDPLLLHTIELLEIRDDELLDVCSKVSAESERIRETFSLIS